MKDSKENIFQKDPVLRALSYRNYKDENELEEKKEVLEKIEHGKSLGRSLTFALKKEDERYRLHAHHSSNEDDRSSLSSNDSSVRSGYFIKKEDNRRSLSRFRGVEELKKYLKIVAISILSQTQDHPQTSYLSTEYGNNEKPLKGHHLFPKEKFITKREMTPTTSPDSSLASSFSDTHDQNMNRMKFLRSTESKIDRIASKDIIDSLHSKEKLAIPEDGILEFYTSKDTTMRQKLQMTDILARTFIFHETDANESNFLKNPKTGDITKIDSANASLTKHLTPMMVPNYDDLQSVVFLGDHILKDRRDDVYTGAKTEKFQHAQKLNKNLITPKSLNDLMKDSTPEGKEKLFLLTIFTKRIQNMIQMDEKVRDYIFSHKILGDLYEQLSLKDQKIATEYLKEIKKNYAGRVKNVADFMKVPLGNLKKMEGKCFEYGYEIPHMDVDYRTARRTLRLANQKGISLNEMKKMVSDPRSKDPQIENLKKGLIQTGKVMPVNDVKNDRTKLGEMKLQ